MSEQQPLLPAHNTYNCTDADASDSGYHRYHSEAAHILEHPRFHKTVIALITIDALCVLADLAYSFLSSDCELPGGEDSPAWLEVLANISLIITTFFLVEIPLNLWTFGLQYMNPFGSVPHAILHLFDTIIILTTFTFEVILRGKERELAGLLVILRLWRLVKLVGGVAVGAGEIEEGTDKELEDTKCELQKAKHQLTEALEENALLRIQLQQLRSP
ncbi:hypothetical protein CPB84DRAFT_1679075 [Gymnopilus junonius]|uniref:Voltage-gated hydrogen channel 1 n=1 Tax=Gymnopilus junonius TaxID=109634 RepID=A0A9P5NP91_GYMJU|nr:hypothetical protein CPB84DRAFT_1679075 [Gymnopilus junonius]